MKADKPLTSRDRQRIETRRRIIEAAVATFAERGFHGASTREIAGRCGVTQGLVTYHFKNKDNLWRRAAEHLFATMLDGIRARVDRGAPHEPRSLAREVVRAYVLMAAEHPELMRFMVQEGSVDDERVQWLIEHCERMLYQSFGGIMTLAGVIDGERPAHHLYYVMAGAGSLIFSIPALCRRLTGVDPSDAEIIERHADIVARLLVPEV